MNAHIYVEGTGVAVVLGGFQEGGANDPDRVLLRTVRAGRGCFPVLSPYTPATIVAAFSAVAARRADRLTREMRGLDPETETPGLGVVRNFAYVRLSSVDVRPFQDGGALPPGIDRAYVVDSEHVKVCRPAEGFSTVPCLANMYLFKIYRLQGADLPEKPRRRRPRPAPARIGRFIDL